MTNNILFRYFGGPLNIFSGPSEHELHEARRLLGHSGTPVDFTVNINNHLFVLTVKVISIGFKKRDNLPLKLRLVKSDLFGLPWDLQASYNPSYEIGTVEALKVRTHKNPPA